MASKKVFLGKLEKYIKNTHVKFIMRSQQERGKKMKKFTLVMMTLVMAAALAGCEKEIVINQIDAEDYTELATSHFDLDESAIRYSDVDSFDGNGEREAYEILDLDLNSFLYIYEDEDDAAEYFEEIYEAYEELVEGEDYEGSLRIHFDEETNNGYVIFCGELDEDIEGTRWVFADNIIYTFCEDQVFYVFASENGDHLERVNALLADLGLPAIE